MRKIRNEHTRRAVGNPLKPSLQIVDDYERYLGRKNLQCQHSKVSGQIEEIIK